MERILHFFNLPAHIRSIVINYKIKKHIQTTNENDRTAFNLISFLNAVIILLCLMCVMYINIKYYNKTILFFSLSGIMIFALVFILFQKQNSNLVLNDISKLILKDENGKNIKVWEINNFNSLLIGKKRKNTMVDIDLSQTSYAMLISREHAVLNNTNSGWYFEDIGSSNGSGIKKKNSGKKMRAEEGRPYKIEKGDTIYIANTKLLID